MHPETTLENLTQALSALAAQGPLRDSAAGFFNALGYSSGRTADAGGVVVFLERLGAAEPLTKRQRTLFDSWRGVEIVFQVTDDEIGGQLGLFEGHGFEAGRIKSFLFLAVELAEGSYTRTRLAETVRTVNRRFAMPVIVLFRHGLALTLAAVHRRAHKRDDDRDVLEKVTLVKDIRAEAPHRAHLDILADLALPGLTNEGVRNFGELHAAWERVLDIEELNRRFYRDLFGWFERAVSACRFPDDGAGAGGTERHVIRLITRLLFIWFLKEKGLVPDELFEDGFARAALTDHAPDRTDYYRAVLQNLFFATLNTEIDRRAFSTETRASHRDFTKYRYRSMLAAPDGFIGKLKSVPFVNGGLFDCLDDFATVGAGGRRIDAFTDNAAQGRELDVPARLFFDPDDGLFPLFRHYKFTVEENTPLDREVALDPELLGRVFENLLASYNPETRETARKATGSYYTPRQVVDYMVREVLAASLAEKSRPTVAGDEFWRERLGYLLDHSDATADAGELFEDVEKRAVVAAIADIRALDPAVGSGAFPMGILQTLTLALRRLDPHNELWEELQKERARREAAAAIDTADKEARDAALLDISRTFETYRDSDFGRKLYLIQNGIYGVDIQPIACQIAKLRFFISLVIEQDPDHDAPNLGIKPLPNLETRFVAADTLIGLGADRQAVLGSPVVSALEDRLRRVRERYFNARTRQAKRQLRDEDTALRAELADMLETLGFDHTNAEAVAAWDLYDQNARAGWFDAEYMFGVADGFDAVIGNPPYVRADFRDERHKITRAAIMANGDYETLWEKWDLFVPFMERGFKLLREGGVSSLIVSDAFGHAKYALKARDWFLRNTLIERIDFYSRIKIFDAAVHNVSYLVRKADGAENEPLRRLHEPAFGVVKELSTGKQRALSERLFFPEDMYHPPPAQCISLQGICYISVGMVVHSHESKAPGAFALNDIVSNTRDATHPKQFVEGKHLDRWLPAGKRWLEWGTERAPGLFRRKAFPELFTTDEKIIAQRSPGPDPKACYDNKHTHFDASSVGFVMWNDLENVRNRSIKKQARYPGESRRSELPRREELERDSSRFSIKYLLGVMNSSAARDFLRAHRRSNIHLYPDDWKRLPIPDVSTELQKPIVDLVNDIFAAKRASVNADVTDLERQIDEAVNSLYGLDDGGIAAREEAALS